MSSPTGADDATKKRPRSTTPTNNSSGSKDEISSKKQKKKKKTQTDINDDYADEISRASSPELLPLLSSSLYRMTNGLPRRELNLIVSEAQACEDALEQELKLLRGALRIEKQEREKAKATITDDVATTSTTDNTMSDKSVTDKKAEEKEKVAEKSSQASTSTTAITTATKSSYNMYNNDSAVDTMIDSEITPTDAHWTLSALLGRLRHELTTPLPPGSQLPAYREKAGLQQLVNSVGLSYSSSSTTSSSSKEKRTTSNATAPPPAAEATISTTATMTDSTAADASSTTENSTDGKISGRSTPNINNNDDNTSNTLELPQYKRLTVLLEHPEFVREQDNTDKLLAIWKKLSTHRSTLVFRRPVNPKEAPGYSDRIRFPIDLSLIRKLIVSKNIKNYHGILQRVHLIAHNCVKYNGRESDYALVTREFESVATEYIFTAVTSPVPVPSPLVVPMPPPLVAPTTTTTTTTTSSGSTDIEPKENITKVSSAVESLNTTHTV
ncbi:putative glucosyltransferase [Fragilariopsis cylindrus CCMP1102]|uniref:Putative glucosyltransferase n=1 Tax=Fragilariopsis cylindrus CCMP1102 TaxID=635003 RepID=A0A1E7FRU5_9STRA|nr:putative glucosyltransferase [Fragilariopsis cylindrus CCMP1102]|eukprot:OEU20834.1 putative glucosyltransferase [Fragilariopsis cylindrus CCMP1102]